MKYQAKKYFKYRGEQMRPGLVVDGPVKPNLVGRYFLAVVDEESKKLIKVGKRPLSDGHLVKPKHKIVLGVDQPDVVVSSVVDGSPPTAVDQQNDTDQQVVDTVKASAPDWPESTKTVTEDKPSKKVSSRKKKKGASSRGRR